jgi:hypothetical protein
LRGLFERAIFVAMFQMIRLHSDPAFYQLLVGSYARLPGRPFVPQSMPVVEMRR